MTDTDSLIYEIQTEDIYNGIIEQPDLYDTSDYPNDHPAYSNKNKGVLGKMKDETNGVPIREFAELRPKMYSLVEENSIEKTTAKGISRATTRKMKHNDYKRALFEEKSERVTMNLITSTNQTITTCTIMKVGLSPYNDKRFVMN